MTVRSLASLLVFLTLTVSAQPLQDDAVQVPLGDWAVPRHLPRPVAQTKLRSVTPSTAPTTPAPRPELGFPGSAATDLLIFVPINPCRLADTRSGTSPLFPAGFGPPSLAEAAPRNFALQQGPCALPSEFPAPEAYSLNVTVVPIAGASPNGGFITIYPGITGSTGPAPGTLPLDASLVWQGSTVYLSNSVIAAGNQGDGSIFVYASQMTDIIIDINGYYAAPTGPGSNTGLGTGALGHNTGGDNTAFGTNALVGPSAGSGNTAVGSHALGNASPGDANTAIGESALARHTASFNTAIGEQAMYQSNTGSNSTAVGTLALFSANGDRNIGVGIGAGDNLSAGSNNIMIGNGGMPNDDRTIRIGQVPDYQNVQTATYIAGIWGNSLTNASPVVINANGQLGVQPVVLSSRRYKEDIQDMSDASTGLLRLRPVTFHYKKPAPDGSNPLEFGLIAEEVDAVYPDLVVRGSDGQIESVQYSKLPAMLLNELQKQYRHAEQQDEMIRKLGDRLAALEAQLANPTAKTTSDTSGSQ